MALFSAIAQPQAQSAATGARLLQRACDCGGKTGGDCQSCRNKNRVQRKAAGGRPVVAQAAMTASPQLTSGGTRLPAPLRRSLAPFYGSDFAEVRVHHDATSEAAAREVSARAFTLGQHIHFAAGQYRPEDREGRRLIAHELAHTLQQGVIADRGVDNIEIDPVDSALEREADAAADAALAARPALAARSARVRAAGARGVQAKLLQRQPTLGGSGIGTAAGGSETASIDRKVDADTVIHIKRTVTERPCTWDPVKQDTPSDKIFYWDREANALGLEYEVCKGRVRLNTGVDISYDKIIESATGLLNTLQSNPALGSDLPGLLNNRLTEATISSEGEITLIIDGILQASVKSGSTVGTDGQQLNVHGESKITPKGAPSFKITGGVDVSKTPLQQNTTYTLQGRAATDNVAVTLGYEQIDTSQVGGPTTQRKITGELGLGIGGASIGPSTSVDPANPKNVSVIGSLSIPLGRDKTPEVSCFKCHCPPPQPQYDCTKVVSPHTRPVVDQPTRERMIKLLYNYNSTVPANEGDFSGNVSTIAGMVGVGFKVEHIYGYASPEGSLDAPKPPVPGFKGNINLSQRRADHARSRLAKEAPTAGLPAAEGKGELLGDLEGSGDTPEKDLTPDLVKLLEPLNDEQRLDALGVDDAVRNSPDQRAAALADIKAFVEGRAPKGLSLAQRPRWEKVFPFLRRVEVSLRHEAVTHEEAVKGGTTSGCVPEDRAYADKNMPPLPPERRLPKEQCEPRR
jgi:hypothetical protein